MRAISPRVAFLLVEFVDRDFFYDGTGFSIENVARHVCFGINFCIVSKKPKTDRSLSLQGKGGKKTNISRDEILFDRL